MPWLACARVSDTELIAKGHMSGNLHPHLIASLLAHSIKVFARPPGTHGPDVIWTVVVVGWADG